MSHDHMEHKAQLCRNVSPEIGGNGEKECVFGLFHYLKFLMSEHCCEFKAAMK